MLVLLLFYLSLTASASLQNLDLTVPNPDRYTSLYGIELNLNFGFSVSNAGDVNGDGINDVIIGAPTVSPAIILGSVYVIFCSKDGIPNIDFSVDLTSSQGFVIYGESIGDSFGFSVGSAGDFNGDGLDDIIVGAYTASSGSISQAGTAYIIFGNRNPPSRIDLSHGLGGAGFKISGSYTLGLLGNSVKQAGDFNGDGLDDVIIGAYGEALNGLASGTAYILFGRKTGIVDLVVPADLTSSDRGIWVAGKALDMVGTSVSGAGDINQDGIDDIIIGAPAHATASIPGQALVIFGRKSNLVNINLNSGLSNTQGIRINGAVAIDTFGFSVSRAGDFNGDGIEDAIIGAIKVDVPGKNDVGAAYVIFGLKGMNSDLNVVNGLSNQDGFAIYGINTNDNFGFSCSNAGDVNGDGMDDIIIGANSENRGADTMAGAAYVFYGHRQDISDIHLADGLESTQGFKIQGTPPSSFLGTSVSSGDINGDGAFDIIVGASRDVNPTLNIQTGSAYFIFGVPAYTNEFAKAIASAQPPATLAAKSVAMLFSLLRYDSGSSLLFSFLVELLYYTRYLEINYPPRLKYMLEQPVPDFISIDGLSSAPDGLENIMTEYSIPDKFEFYKIDSSFLVNFWPAIMMLLILIIITVFSVIMEYFTRSNKWLNDKFLKLTRSMKWNYLIVIFVGYFCNISLYTSLQMRTVKFSSFSEGFSFAVCIIINLILIFVMFKMFWILREIRIARKTASDTESQEHMANLKPELQNFEVFYNDYKDNSFSQCHLFILCIRFYVFYLIIANLVSYPILQTSIISAMGLAFIAFLVIKRPFKRIKDLIMSFSQEIILEIVNISALVLAITDNGKDEDDNARVVFGDIIIGCNLAFILVSLIYTCVIATILFRDAFRFIRSKLFKKKVEPVKVVYLPEKAKLESSSFVSNPETQRTLINDNTLHQSISFKHSDDLSIMQDIPVKFTKQIKDMKSEAVDLKATSLEEAPSNILSITKLSSIPNAPILEVQKGNTPEEAVVYRQTLHNDRSSRKMRIITKSIDINQALKY